MDVTCDISNVPQELKAIRRWGLWKAVDKRKVPFNLVNGKLVAVDAKTFNMSFEDCVLLPGFNTGYGAMVYIVPEDNLFCLDFDNFYDEKEIKEIVSKAGSYAEKTPSKGFRIWFRGTPSLGTIKLRDGRAIEVFNNRQIVVTGKRISEEQQIKECSIAFNEWLLDRYMELMVFSETKEALGQEYELSTDLEQEVLKLLKKDGFKETQKGVMVHCPFHLPDQNMSAIYYKNTKKLICFHDMRAYSLQELAAHYGLKDHKLDQIFSRRIKGVVEFVEKFYEGEFKYYVVRVKPRQVVFLRTKAEYPLGHVEVSMFARNWLEPVLKELDAAALHTIFKTIVEYMRSEWGVKLDSSFLSKFDEEFRDLLINVAYTLNIFQKSRDFALFYEEEEKEITRMDQKEYERILRYGFFKGGKYDELITEIWPAYWYSFEHNPDLAPYSPHSLLVTNTKAGKSTLSSVFVLRSRVDIKADGQNVTVPALLGFSTANETVDGLLNRVKGVAFIDEVQETDKQCAAGLLSMMEQGQVFIVKGKRTILTNYNNAFVFLSNQKIEEDLERGFLQMLNLINENTEALGSRIALVLFRDNLVEAGVDERYQDYEMQDLYFEKAITLRKKVSQWFLSLFNKKEIRDWLNQPFEKEYLSQLESYSSKATTLKVKAFIKAHKRASRHLRGMALRLALYDPVILLKYINEGQENLEEILEVAEDKFSFLKYVNLESFLRISSILADETIVNEYIHLNAANNAFKILLVAIRAYYDVTHQKVFDTKNKKENEFVRFYNEFVKAHVPIQRYAVKYTSLEERVVVPTCAEELGLRVVKDDDALYIKIEDENLWAVVNWLEKVKIGEILAKEIYDKVMGEVSKREQETERERSDKNEELQKALRVLLGDLCERYGDRLLPLDVLKKTMGEFPVDQVMSELYRLQERGFVLLFEQDNAFMIVRRPEVVE
ncbi:MAG: hypothetical protein QW279_11395 [Candidatus Jordarchaeaceae archaeon]